MQLSKEEANTRETVEVYRRYKEVVEGTKDTEELLGKTWMRKWQKWLKKNYLT